MRNTHIDAGSDKLHRSATVRIHLMLAVTCSKTRYVLKIQMRNIDQCIGKIALALAVVFLTCVVASPAHAEASPLSTRDESGGLAIQPRLQKESNRRIRFEADRIRLRINQ